MKKSKLNMVVMIMITINLVMAMMLFYNGGVMIDELSLSAAEYYGNEFWLNFAWLNLLLLFVTFILTFVNLIKRND